MKARRYEVTMKGESPLLMHKDNIEFGERIRKWQKDPKNKDLSVAGDDRSPAWTWLSYCYNDGEKFVIDIDNVMSCLRDGGAKVKHPNGRGSLKTQTQSGIIAEGLGWELLVAGNPVPWAPFADLEGETDFSRHEALAEKFGFRLFMKRAMISGGFGKGSKHVRVRPMFEDWTVRGSILVLDEILTTPVLETLFTQCGFYIGIGDWRPGGKTPGQFGRFSATLKEVEA